MQSDSAPRESGVTAPDFSRGGLWPVDVLNAVFLALLFAVTLAGASGVPRVAAWLAFDAAAIGVLAAIVMLSRRRSARTGALARLAHGVVVVPLVFTQVGILIAAVRRVDFAPILERFDRVLFLGVNPLNALEAVSVPWLTEIMQWAYTSYLLLPVGIVVLLAWKARGVVLSRSLFALLGVMYLSYVGYFLVPAAGPNIHSNLGPLAPVEIPTLPLYSFATDLPGVWLTEPLRRWMFAVELTKKDCFPSGHVAVAIVCWVLARRVGRRFGPAFFVAGLGVTLSTIYLRYHYVVDVLAGALLAWFSVTGWLRLHDRLAAPQIGRS